MSKDTFIEIERGNYISRIWFFHQDGVPRDVLMVLSRRLPDGDWTLKYRFRYHEDDRAHDSADRFSYWGGTFSAGLSEAEAVRKVGSVLSMLKAKTRLRHCDVTVIESDNPQVFFALMKGKPYSHIRFEEIPS